MKKKLTFSFFIISIVFYLLSNKTHAITTSLNFEDQSIESSIFSLSPASPKIVELSLVPHEPIEIIEDGNFTDYGFTGLGEETDPYIIEGFNITTDEEYGISITDTTKYFVIRDCFVAADYGIFIENATVGTSTLINNTCTNSIHGLWLKYSSGSNLINNTCTNNNGIGIALEYSDGSTLVNNSCSNNGGGIYLGHSSVSNLTENTCINNYYGIHLYASSGSILTCNSCNNNSFGIHLEMTDSCLFTYNVLHNNNLYGINLEILSNSNNVHHNNFTSNNLGGISQGYDEGTDNVWYDIATNEGNYWSNWSGIGSYSIDGDAGSIDPYPLDEDGNPPVVSEFPKAYSITIVIIFCLALVPCLFKRRRKSF